MTNNNDRRSAQSLRRFCFYFITFSTSARNA
jgi:hypothetical protein